MKSSSQKTTKENEEDNKVTNDDDLYADHDEFRLQPLIQQKTNNDNK